MDRISRDPTTVVCPVIDVLDDDTLEYHYRDSTGVNVGGFDWNLQVSIEAVEKDGKTLRNVVNARVHVYSKVRCNVMLHVVQGDTKVPCIAMKMERATFWDILSTL